MNTAIKRGNRQPDNFVLATENSVRWARTNRRTTVLFGGLAFLLIALIAGGYSLYQYRTGMASTAFGGAMQVYQTPLARPGQPPPPGVKVFNSAAERAGKANGLFADVAQRFNFTEPGRLALYFQGLTYMEEGNNGAAEDTLKKVAAGWNGDTAALGKLALAQLYGQTGQSGQAVSLYQELIKGHATTVPPTLAQIQLAELYESEGKTGDARQLYAALKDHDKDAKGKEGVAAQVASSKLNPQAAPAAAGPR